jgi:UDP-glucose 4-epimerase
MGKPAVVVDDLSTGFREAIPRSVQLFEGDVGDPLLLQEVFRTHPIDAVIHLAGSILVEESVTDPLRYYRNNIVAGEALLRACTTQGVARFLFSSSAAVYGAPSVSPIAETTPAAPINPYGRSKLIFEWMLRDVEIAQRAAGKDFRHLSLRYFNVAGADPSGRAGQSTKVATHLIKVASRAAMGPRSQVSIFGTDYATPDGTCVRDYIHVSDLADIHVAALDQMDALSDLSAMNCGYGRGYSVREVLTAVNRLGDHPFEVADAARRPGDPPSLVADNTLLRTRLTWQPKHDALDEIISTALSWERRTQH